MKWREDINLGRQYFLDKYGQDMEPLYNLVTTENIRDIVNTSLIHIREWKQKRIAMGRVSDLLIGMEEDAVYKTKDSWLVKYGNANKEVWDKVHGAVQDQLELEIAPND